MPLYPTGGCAQFPVFDSQQDGLCRVPVNIDLGVVGGPRQTVFVADTQPPNTEIAVVEPLAGQVTLDGRYALARQFETAQHGEVALGALKETDRVQVDLRSSVIADLVTEIGHEIADQDLPRVCLLYTSDAADDNRLV